MRRVFLITLFILLLPSADMITTDGFVEWEKINPYINFDINNFVYYSNGNLVAYDGSKSIIFNSSLLYDSDNVIENYWYYRINETDAFYDKGLSDHGTVMQAFHNPIKNDTYLVTNTFNIWKYNDTFYINNTKYEIFEGRVMTWYNLTDDYSYRPPSRSSKKLVYDYQNNIIMMYGGLGYADTWIFDINSKEWINAMPLNQPGLLAYYGMTYNDFDGKIYLHGGISSFEGVQNDLWEYDYLSNTWTEISVNNELEARYDHGMLYDTYNDKLLIYDYNPGKELWAYDFKSKYWTFVSSNAGPSSGYEDLIDWIMYGNSSLIFYNYDFYKLTLEMESSPPGTEIIVTHTETVTTATISTETDYTTVTDKTTETNYEDVTLYENFTSLIDGTTVQTPFYTLGLFSVFLVMLIRKRSFR